MNISRKKIGWLVLGLLLWAFLFAPWEFAIYDRDHPEIGKKVSFDEPLVSYFEIPNDLAGPYIRRKYNMVMFTRKEWEDFWHFQNVKKTFMPTDSVYTVESVFTSYVVGAVQRTFDSPSKVYVLRTSEGRKIPTRKTIYEGYKKNYH